MRGRSRFNDSNDNIIKQQVNASQKIKLYERFREFPITEKFKKIMENCQRTFFRART